MKNNINLIYLKIKGLRVLADFGLGWETNLTLGFRYLHGIITTP